jgi:hypothetical protein
MKRLLLGVGLACILSAVSLSAAPKNNSSEPSTITLNAPALFAASSTSWEPRLGDYVSFTVTYPKTLEHYGVRIQVLCYQNGELVYGEAGPYYQSFLLGGAMSQWFLTDGAATCRADLFYWSYQGGQKFNLLTSTEFEAGAR